MYNKNYAKKRYKYHKTFDYSKSIFQDYPDELVKIRGNSKKINFKTEYFLPVNYSKKKNFGNPQSIQIVGKYAYIMYTLKGGSNYGFVARYNLSKLKLLGVTNQGTMSIFRKATYNFKNNKTSDLDNEIMKCIKVGPTKRIGHGQSMAYNPKSKQMWFITKNKINATIQRLDMKTLKPKNKINFRLNAFTPMGANLTFDKKGNAYYYSYSSGGPIPKKTVKLYKGKITNKSVKFKIIMQGIRRAPGATAQSISYNPKNNNLYLISDSGVSRIPIKRLGKLRKKDIRTVITNQKREFEGLGFTKKGIGYLMPNKGPELMKLSNANF
ncbi:hypothetical protein GSH19_07035 [Lactobacillus sp. S2-2]|uniref:hypothetical protein n=1 Tax=Lactobacillus sp. S2-2 TaxID=2692917 RepID=UPI001F38B4B5|nr:hypothetical protein [Lactobacillus sp. S2-2]MCF6515897.1 hypothetical protein [Lactobacillus sp. S2-2]